MSLTDLDLCWTLKDTRIRHFRVDMAVTQVEVQQANHWSMLFVALVRWHRLVDLIEQTHGQ